MSETDESQSTSVENRQNMSAKKDGHKSGQVGHLQIQRIGDTFIGYPGMKTTIVGIHDELKFVDSMDSN